MTQLLPQDIVLAVRLLDAKEDWTFASLGKLIGISASQCHLSFGRLGKSGLLDTTLRTPIRSNLLELLEHGIRYFFPGIVHGEMVTGIPTAHSAPVWKGKLIAPNNISLVWQHPKGQSTGLQFEPLYKTVPTIALAHEKTYSILAVVDSLRIGKAREKKAAATLLKELMYNE